MKAPRRKKQKQEASQSVCADVRSNIRLLLRSNTNVENITDSDVSKIELRVFELIGENSTYYFQCILLLLHDTHSNIHETISHWKTSNDCMVWVDANSCPPPDVTSSLQPQTNDVVPTVVDVNEIFGDATDEERRQTERERTCPSCGRTNVKISTVQDRSGDEPASVVFVCDCGKRRRKRG